MPTVNIVKHFYFQVFMMTEPRLPANASQESLGLEYFSTPARLGLIQQIVYMLQFGEGLPVVQGAAGSGKTFIAAELANSLSAHSTVARVNVKPQGELDDILRDISQCLSLTTGGVKTCGELLASLRSYITELVALRQLSVVIIDNAHLLDESALGALLSLLQGDFDTGKGFKMVFFARPGLVAQIDALQLVDLAVFDFDVPSMSLGELQAFIADFYPELSGLPRENITQAWNESGGNPGSAIGILGQLEHQSATKPRLSFNMPKLGTAKAFSLSSLSSFALPVKHVLFLIVIVVVFVWVLLLRNGDRAPVLASPKAPVPLREKIDTIVEGEELVSDLEIAAIESEQSEIIAKAATPWPRATDGPEAPLGQVPERERAPAEPAAAPEKNLAVASSGKQAVKPAASAHSSDEQHLLDQPPEYFTLQVLSSARSLSLSSYLLRQSNRKQLYLYRSLRNGERRYVVVAGIYKTRAEAIAARASLPKEQRQAGPWPRSLKSVQREIEKF